MSLTGFRKCRPEMCLPSRNEDPKEQRKPCGAIVAILQPTKPYTQPDGLYAHFVCFCGFLSILLAVSCSYSYGLLFPVLLDEFKEGKAKTGKKFSRFGLGSALVRL